MLYDVIYILPSTRSSRAITKWRRLVESAERNWKDCSVEDREQMRTELTKFLERLRPDIEASTIDDFTKADLVERAWSLHHDAGTLQWACAIMSA